VQGKQAGHRAKLAILWAIVLLTVFASSAKLILLRQGSGPPVTAMTGA